jgi:hypothetical protein
MAARAGRRSSRTRERQQLIQDTLRRVRPGTPVDTGAGTGAFPPGRLPSISAPIIPGPRGADSLVPGPPGNPGAPGAPGAAGAQGTAGIGVPGRDGRNGRDALLIPGAKGDPGAAGGAGPAGPQGTQGQGVPGVDGKTGKDSFIPGPKGDPGVAGGVGATGAQGNAGPPMAWIERVVREPSLFIPPKKYSGTNGFLLTGNGNEAEPTFKSLITTRLTADNAAIPAATPTSVVAVAGLTQLVGLNEEWDIEWILELANSIAADVFVFNILTSGGTLGGRYTVLGANGVPNAGAAVMKFWQMPAGTITVANANAPGATGTIGLVTTVMIRARVKLTVAGGTISVGVRAGTNAAVSSGTATVKAASQLIANRIA